MAETKGLGELRKLLDSAGLPELGPGPRAGVMDYAALMNALRPLLATRMLSTSEQALVRALLLLWHDDFDAAHALAQSDDSAEGSFVHGILHRREPDYANAAYWFRRVGEHDCFPTIARRVGELLDAKSEKTLKSELVPDGKWDPFAFIRLCEKASAKSPDAARTELLRQIQGIETEAVLEYLLGA